MAKAPSIVRILRESLGNISSEVASSFDKMLANLNPFMMDVAVALKNGLTFEQNFAADVIDMDFIAPSTADSTGFIAASYHTPSSPVAYSASTNTTINFSVKTFDTYDSVTTGSNWKFTVPAGFGGYYLINTSVGLLAPTAGAYFTTLVHNATTLRVDRTPTNSSGSFKLSSSLVVKVVAGDVIYLQVFGTSAFSTEGDDTFITLSLLQRDDPDESPLKELDLRSAKLIYSRGLGYQVLRCDDITGKSPIHTPVPVATCFFKKRGNYNYITLSNIAGLSPGRRYRLKLLVY